MGDGDVTPAVERTIRELDGRAEGVAASAEAALALSLARRIDDEQNSATSVSLNAGRLLDALERLRRMAPEKAKESPLDEIRARRDKRIAGKPGAQGRVGPRRRRTS